ncbi:hypothetical protein TU18-25_00005, partial [Vibrio phage ICP3_2009_A]
HQDYHQVISSLGNHQVIIKHIIKIYGKTIIKTNIKSILHLKDRP